MRPLSIATVLFMLLIGMPAAAAEPEPLVAESAAAWDASHLSAPNRSYLETTLEGKGGLLRLSYSSRLPLEAFIAPADADGYEFTDLLHVTLPAGEDHQAMVDITASPGWSPSRNLYFLSILNPDATGNTPGIQRADLLPLSGGEVAVVALRQLAAAEPYKPSTYHFLEGYRVLGVSLAPLFGVIVLLAAALLGAWRRDHRVFLGTLVTGLLLYQGRVALDLLRLSVAHVSAWERDGTYAAAGSLHHVGTFLRDAGSGAILRIVVCADSTNYAAKLLRYAAYPHRVTENAEAGAPPTHVVVTQKLDWRYDKGSLACGSLRSPATKVREWPDGTILFALPAA